jgi:hypothetical protein
VCLSVMVLDDRKKESKKEREVLETRNQKGAQSTESRSGNYNMEYDFQKVLVLIVSQHSRGGNTQMRATIVRYQYQVPYPFS